MLITFEKYHSKKAKILLLKSLKNTKVSYVLPENKIDKRYFTLFSSTLFVNIRCDLVTSPCTVVNYAPRTRTAHIRYGCNKKIALKATLIYPVTKYLQLR